MNEDIDRYTKMVVQYPDNEVARFSLGKAYFDAATFGEAKKHFELAVKRKPDWMVAHILIGKSALSLGDIPGARASFTKAHQLAIDQHHEGPQTEMESMLADLE